MAGKTCVLVEVAERLAGERVDHREPLDLVAEQLDAHRRLLVGRVDLDGVAAHPELAAHEVHVVALVLHVDEPAQDGALVVVLADAEVEQLPLVLLGRAQAVDADTEATTITSRRVSSADGGRVAQPVDLVVDRRVLLDVGVARRRCTPRAGSSRSS